VVRIAVILNEMKLYHIIIMLSCGFIAGSVLIFIFGDDGYLAYSRLSRHREVLEKNIEDLKKKNTELKDDVSTLMSNPEAIRVLARKLGYYKDDEILILLDDNPSMPGYGMPRYYEIGTMVNTLPQKTGRNTVLRFIGFAISILITIAIYAAKKRKSI
jgi:cell division protein FtsB